ncbi:MAG: tetratricopeptide repeat protein, partial [Candidatus Eremiobacterota bacterium]
MASRNLVQAARYLQEVRRYERAIEHLEEHLASYPEDGEAWTELACCLYLADRDAEALKPATEAVRCSPRSPDAFSMLALVYGSLNHWDPCLKALETALELDPGDPCLRGTAAGLAHDRGDYAEALRQADTGIRLHSCHRQCLLARAQALMATAQAARAEAELSEMAARWPDAEILGTLGRARFLQGKLQAAREPLASALRLDPENEDARNTLVELLRCQNPVYGAFLGVGMRITQLPRWVKLLLAVALVAFLVLVPLEGAASVLYFLIAWLLIASRSLSTLLLSLHPTG